MDRWTRGASCPASQTNRATKRCGARAKIHVLLGPALQDVDALQLVRSFHDVTQDPLSRRRVSGQDDESRSVHNVEAEADVRRVSRKVADGVCCTH